MKADLVIRGGTVVDGSGAPGIEADVAVAGDRIVAVGGDVGTGADEIDARGCIVTPGFVDVHTHLDAQLTWDPLGAPACWHGITSLVVGNCGVGFAPCRPADRDYLMFLMEGVEDIPRAALAAGLRWGWETFGEYLDALGRQPLGPNVGAYAAHAALRLWAMGRRGATEEAPDDAELAALRAAAVEALAGGALGISTGRTTMHRTPAGDAVPGTFADARELGALAAALRSVGRGLLQVIPYGGGGEDPDGLARDLPLVLQVARASGRPLSVALAAPRRYPEAWRGGLETLAAAAASGVRVVPQVAPRAIGLLLGFGGLLSPLLLFPAAGELLERPEAEVLAALRDAALRRRLVASIDPSAELMAGLASWDVVFPLDGTGVRAYETTRARSVAGRAAARGVTPAEVVLDWLVGTELRGLLMLALYNGDLDAAGAMLAHPLSVPGLGDAGAHTSQTCDAGVPTFILAYWVRERGLLPLETAVRKLTSEPASAWGLAGRGLVRPGWFADLNVVDLARLDLGAVELRRDLPGGALNLSQRATGYRATVVNGALLVRDGEHTGVHPGRVLRTTDVAP